MLANPPPAEHVSPESDPGSEGARRTNLLVSVAIYGFLGLLLIGLLLTREYDPAVSRAHMGQIWGLDLRFDRNAVDDLFGILCGSTAFGLLIYAWRHHLSRLPVLGWLRRHTVHRCLSAGLIALVLASGISWLYLSRGVAHRDYIKYWDSYHYVIGPKYYDELGYFDLYNCTLLAQSENLAERGVSLDLKRRIRDLRSYKHVRVGQVLEQTKACREQFSDARWQEFRHDVEFYNRQSRTWFYKILGDHGYNGTPLHALVSGTLANLVPIEYLSLTLATLFDSLGILAMMFALSCAFGWRRGAIFSILFFTAFNDRAFFIAGSFFRYYWLIPTGFALAALHTRRYATAAACLTAAAMLNVFPLLFFLGLGLKIAYGWWRERSIASHYRRFILAAAISTAVLGGISVAHGRGLDNYRDFMTNMSSHSGLLTRSRIGYKYNFLYRGEVYEDDKRHSWAKKRAELAATQPFRATVVTLFLGLCALISLRLRDTEATILCGFSSFFGLFGTVEYYFGIYAFVVFLWSRHLGRLGGRLMLSLPFLMMSLVHLGYHETRSLRFCNNTLMSATITVVLLAGLTYLARVESPRPTGSHDTTLARWLPWKAAPFAVAFTALLTLAGAFYTYFEYTEHEVKAETGPVVAFGGDVTLARRMNAIAAEKGYTFGLAQLPQLREADLAIANLECVISEDGESRIDKDERASFYFGGRPELAAILKSSGLDMLATANNHSGDYGHAALLRQNQILSGMHFGLAGTGNNWSEACAPSFRRAGHIDVALFSVDATTANFAAGPQKPGSCYIPLDDRQRWKDELSPRIKAARKRADIVLVAVHWGKNFRSRPTKAKIAAGKAIIEAGADAVLGSSAHEPQGIDVHRGRPIIHDAGNLLGEYRDDDIDAILTSLVLSTDGVTQVWIDPIRNHRGFSRPAKGKRADKIIAHVTALSKKLGTQLRIQGQRAVLELGRLPRRKRPNERLPTNPTIGLPPSPATTPPPSCIVTEVPEDARIEPVKLGPLTLVGMRLDRPLIDQRKTLWVETFWQTETDNLGDFQLGLSGKNIEHRADKRWSGRHEPCAWKWPTSRWQTGVIYRDDYGLRPPSRPHSGTLAVQVELLSQGRPLGPAHRLTTVPMKIQKN